MNEEWKSVPGYEGLYEVSSMGVVRSIPRIRSHGGEGGLSRSLQGRIIRPWLNSKGYLNVALSKDGIVSKFRVPTLVADAFLGPKQECVNHKDGNKLNNEASNIERCTYSQNNQHAFDNGLKPPTVNQGEKCGTSKMTNEKVLEIRALGKRGHSGRTISKMFGLHNATVCRILRRTTWFHI